MSTLSLSAFAALILTTSVSFAEATELPPTPAGHAVLAETGTPVPMATATLPGYAGEASTAGGTRGVGSWTGRGPWGANIRGLVEVPGYPQRIVCAAGLSLAREAGGIWVSTDGGVTWLDTAVNGKPGNEVCVSRSEPGVVYAAMYDGLYRSTDAGSTWSVAAYAGSQIIDIGVKADDGQILIAGLSSNRGIRRSTDGGATWQSVGLEEDYMKGLGVSPANPDRMYLAMSAAPVACYRSTDAGASWTAVGPGTDGWGVWVDPANADRVFLTTSNGVYRSLDGGTTWVLAVAGTSYSPIAERDGVLYAPIISQGVHESTDGGFTWTPNTSGIVAQFWQAATGTSTGVLVGHWGGVYRSTAPGSTWVVAQTGLNNGFFHTLAYYADRQELWAGGEHHGVWKSTDLGVTWSMASAGLPTWTIYAIAPKNHEDFGFDRMYLATDIGVYRSDDHGQTWAPAGLAGTYISDVAAHWTDPDRIWAIDNTNHMFRSENGGATWTPCGSGLPFAFYGNIVLGEVGGQIRLHVSFQQNATATYYSDDLGQSFTPSTGLESTTYQPALSLRREVLGTHDEGLYCGTSAGVYLSADHGATWTYSGLTGLVWSLLGSRDRYVFAGRDRLGVYYSEDAGANWYADNDGIETAVVWDVVYGQNILWRFCSVRGAGVREYEQEALDAPEPIVATASFRLSASPNPLGGGSGRLAFSLPAAEPVEVRIFDAAGARVASDRFEGAAGGNTWVWDGRRSSGDAVPSGLYWVQVEAGGARAGDSWVVIR